MGVSISATIYKLAEVVEDVEAAIAEAGAPTEGKLLVRDLIQRIAPKVGTVVPGGEYFVVVYNEYYDGYNPSWAFEDLVARYYGIEDSGAGRGLRVPGGADADGIAEALDIELPEREED